MDDEVEGEAAGDRPETGEKVCFGGTLGRL